MTIKEMMCAAGIHKFSEFLCRTGGGTYVVNLVTDIVDTEDNDIVEQNSDTIVFIEDLLIDVSDNLNIEEQPDDVGYDIIDIEEVQDVC